MRFKGNLNLMALKGAQVLNVTLPDGSQRACVVIPAAFNDMLTKDGNVSAYLDIVAWEANQAYIDKCNQNHAGEDGYVAPSHTVELSMRSDFRQRAEEAATSRIKAEKPGIGADDLKREVARAVRIQLGTLTPMPTERRGYAPQGVASAVALPSNPAPEVATSAAEVRTSGNEVTPNEDLPF